MDTAIPISAINDFVFCPKSLYLHSIYDSFTTSVYHDTPQTRGKIVHKNIEDRRYTTSKHVLQGLFVYSVRLGVKGKIDIYDSKNLHLIERKYRIKKVFDGYRYQLYAQMYGLEEAGYHVKRLSLYSLADNKRYKLRLPDVNELKRFETLVKRIHTFNVSKNSFTINPAKCARCIYRRLCDSCAYVDIT